MKDSLEDIKESFGFLNYNFLRRFGRISLHFRMRFTRMSIVNAIAVPNRTVHKNVFLSDFCLMLRSSPKKNKTVIAI